MARVMGVDSSTQSCKVVVRDSVTGALLAAGRAAHPDGTEVDPNAWWAALTEALTQAGGLSEVAAVSIAGQQHGMVVLDADGRVIRPALLWNDTRSAQAALDLIAEVGAEEYVRRTGVLPVASFTATKLRWLRDHEAENAARVAAVCLPHDWLTWRLRGFGPVGESTLGPALTELVTDRSDASGTAYFSPTTGEYDRELLRLALGHDAVLPRLLGPVESVPGDGFLVGAGAGDNAAAALGLDARPGDVVVSLGTSGTVFAAASEPAADVTGTVAGFADATGGYLPLVCTLNAARTLDAMAELLGVDHDGLSQLALAAEPGSGGVVLVPYFEGERTPNLPDATASLRGLTLTNLTRANLARAAIEGMLSGLAAGVAEVRRQGAAVDRIRLIGGAAASPAVQVVAAQVFEARVEVPEPGEYVADGAARQAGWILTGQRPSWPVALLATLEADPQPQIGQQYRAAAATYR
ncbi:xylulokinase [Propionicimonas sp.]|uniref:xylulokinase n=1 Tax=Propionicimonas sp. TaxID=1955623 RepID=UPI00182DA6EB|nr:xylulokinase [Propionicimonas sp.]MBU3977085.1 xylulokinase [Actinomycetota bacterium]MBA3020654.1 xylulokinase [Propionicimonas sp.]MBU3985025.1 xylulokinase [Actinomycetota bacterium]MBU4007018.1 xylulokinase [Actinomycetota bacterium]MBU4064771.1 xylulokinase [Actinomycetota bacterium]